MNDYMARVQKGAALLDEKRPGWEKEIDIGILDIMDGRWCVLGQLYGYYTIGATVMGIGYGNQEYGFARPTPLADLPTLTNAWRALIATRLAEEVQEESRTLVTTH